MRFILASISWLFSTDSILFWEILEALSIIIVGVGAWGEVWAERKKRPNEPLPGSIDEMFRGRKWKEEKEKLVKKEVRCFWRLLLFGLAVEFLSFGFSVTLSWKEIESLRQDNLKLYAQIQPRRLTIDQQNGIASALAPLAGRSADVESYSFDPDGIVLAFQIGKAMGAAGLKVNTTSFTPGSGGIEFGINVRGTDAELVKAIATALRSGGLQNVAENPPRFRYSEVLGAVGGRADGQAVIMVGAKPPANPNVPFISRP